MNTFRQVLPALAVMLLLLGGKFVEPTNSFYFHIIGLVMVALLVWWCCWPRNPKGKEQKSEEPAPEPAPVPAPTEEERIVSAKKTAQNWVDAYSERHSLNDMIASLDALERLPCAIPVLWIPYARQLLQPYIDTRNCWLGTAGAPGLPPFKRQWQDVTLVDAYRNMTHDQYAAQSARGARNYLGRGWA